ncbi:MAG TPA: 1-acyl-sn-glycerol-3-phosphate acyltransferase, partial [Saprospiraceae bacterium]|nr:1-acyl-sn-glycerol-3-phosphate acyltransferase [Saprospiraceae bacterium]
RLNGHCQEVRALFEEHVVVLVPTHSSNLDSILVGYSVDASLGLPAFSYGAGLNLFDSEFFAFFMNRLGAYKVDRRKKNSIYLQTLNSYSKRSILEGVNTIFFPGGTRSRSGEVESKVKLGLLGSLVQAQRIFLEQGSSKKVVIVPVVIGYESVLEARSLIIQYLRTTGQEKYTARVKRPGIGSYLRFARRLFRMGSSITLTYGAPMDVFGNRLGSNGESYDHHGKQIQISDYFKTDGQLAADSQREMIYTRELGDQIGKAYQNYNYILPAHLVAYAAFKLLSRMHPQMDIYSVVQIPEEDFVFPRKGFEMLCGQIRTLLFERAERGELIYPAELEGELSSVIRKGIQTLGVFHIQRILMIDEFGRLLSEDFLGLLYYSNKMINLELDEAINWTSIPFDLVELDN